MAQVIWFFIFVLFALRPGVLLGQRELPSLYLSTGIGLATYKSEAVESNDTNFTIGYSLGIRGGTENELSMSVSSESSSTNFKYAGSQAKSKIATTFQDTALSYHWGYIYFGLVFSHSEMTATNQDASYLDNIALATGFNGGTIIPVGKGSHIFIDFTQTSASATKDIVQGSTNAVKLGSRSDIFIGGIIKLTRSLLSTRIGYKQRTFAVSVSGKTFQEQQTMTWIGLDFNVFL